MQRCHRRFSGIFIRRQVSWMRRVGRIGGFHRTLRRRRWAVLLQRTSAVGIRGVPLEVSRERREIAFACMDEPRTELRRNCRTLYGWEAAHRTEAAEWRIVTWCPWRLGRKWLSGALCLLLPNRLDGRRGARWRARCNLVIRLDRWRGIRINFVDIFASASSIYTLVFSLLVMTRCFCIVQAML